MKKILGTLVVVALILGSSSALAAPGRSSKAMEVRQAADRAIEGPTFIRAAVEWLARTWELIARNVGGSDRDFSAKMEPGPTDTKQDATIIAPAIVKNVGGSD